MALILGLRVQEFQAEGAGKSGGFRCSGVTVLGFWVFLCVRRLLRGSWAFRGRVPALGARVWDLIPRVQEPYERPLALMFWVLDL